jgi:hypothetical protein
VDRVTACRVANFLMPRLCPHRLDFTTAPVWTRLGARTPMFHVLHDSLTFGLPYSKQCVGGVRCESGRSSSRLLL